MANKTYKGDNGVDIVKQTQKHDYYNIITKGGEDEIYLTLTHTWVNSGDDADFVKSKVEGANRIDLGGGEARLEVAPAPAELAQLGRGRVLVIEGVGGPALPLAEAVGIAQPAGTAEREQGQRHQPGSGPLGPEPAQQLAFSSQVATNEALSTWSKMQSHESQEANETAP